MTKYCINCGYDLSKVKMTKLESASPSTEVEEILIKKKPKKVVRRIQEEEEEEQQPDPQQELLKKVAEKLVIKSKANGVIDVRKKVSEKQAIALEKNRAVKAVKAQEAKKTGVYKYNKKEKIQSNIGKEPEPAQEQPPPKSYYNPYSGIF